MLARDIHRRPCRAPAAERGRQIDDAAAPLNLHHSQLVFQAENRAEHVGLKGRRVTLGSLFRQRAGLTFRAGVVHCHVQSAEPLDRLVDQEAYIRLLAHIGGILNHDGYVKLLRDAEGRSEIVDLVRDAERMIFGDARAADEEDDGREGGKDPVLA